MPLSYLILTVRQNSIASIRGTPAILTGCRRMSKRPGLPLCLCGLLTAGCIPHTCWPVYAKQARLPGARHGGIYGVWECQADRLYETVAWETSQDPPGSRVVVQAHTWGVGARVCWGRGRLRQCGSLMVPLHASNWGSLPGPAHGQQAKTKVGQSNPKSQGTLEERVLEEGTLPNSAPTSEPPPFRPHFHLATSVGSQ